MLIIWLLFSFLTITESSYHLVWYSKDTIPKSHIDVHSNFHFKASRRPKQLIGASVVTSVSSVKDHDPEIMKRQYEDEYRANNDKVSGAMVMEPKFYFYLYNNEGDLIREKLSIHDIQSLLLQETQIQGLKNRGWLFEEKEPDDQDSSTPPTTTPIPKKPSFPSRNATQKDVKEVLDKIHNIIQDAKNHNKNEIVLSNQINISEFENPLKTTILDDDDEQFESKTGDFKIYEDRYHGLNNYEHPWVDITKQQELADLEEGLSKPISRTSPIKDDLSYFPVHPQEYRNKLFKDILSLDYETSPYDEEDGSSAIHMISIGNESDLVPTIYADDDEDNAEIEEEEKEQTRNASVDESSTHDHGDQHAEDHHHHESHHEHDHGHHHHDHHGEGHHHHHPSPDKTREIPSPPKGNLGLLSSTQGMDRNMKHFIDINNDLSLHLYSTLREKNTSNINLVFSPLSAISTLSMIFLGARGMSSWQMNELLHLDEMISFNPHLLYKELMDSIMTSGSAGFVKQMFIDHKEDPFIDFYKSRIQYFYNGHADQVDFAHISSEFKERINSLFKEVNPSQSENIIANNHVITSGPPMAVMGASYFNCEPSLASLDVIQPTEVNFINLPSFGRRLVPINGLTLQGKLYGSYDPELDATSVQIPLSMPLNLSLILILPGKPSEFKVGGLSTLESKLNLKSWNALLKKFVPLEEAHVYIPELKEESLINLNTTFSHMGSTEIFGKDANFVGINGGRDLRLSSFYEFCKFSLESTLKKPSTTKKPNTEEEPYIFRFERQFLYVLRHDPTGLITSIGRYVKPKLEDL